MSNVDTMNENNGIMGGISEDFSRSPDIFTNFTSKMTTSLKSLLMIIIIR